MFKRLVIRIIKKKTVDSVYKFIILTKIAQNSKFSTSLWSLESPVSMHPERAECIRVERDCLLVR